MKKVKLVIVVAMVLISSIVTSQRTYVEEQAFMVMRSKISLGAPEEGVHGSPYVNSDFKNAKFVNSDKEFLMRYNAFKDLIEVKVNDSIFVLPNNLNYSVKFEISNKQYKVYQFNEVHELTTGLFVVIKEMETKSLLLKEAIKIEVDKIHKIGFLPYVPPTFKRIRDRLFVGYNNTVDELPNNKKEILKHFGAKADIVSKKAKKMKWRFKRNSDLIEIFKFYYSLN